MPSRLDDLSLTIGEIRQAVRELGERAIEDRRTTLQAIERRDNLADQRHAENQAQIGSVKVMIADVMEKLENHAIAVAAMEPKISSLQSSRNRLAAYATVGIVTLAAAGYLLEAAIKAAVTWVITKFGG